MKTRTNSIASTMGLAACYFLGQAYTCKPVLAQSAPSWAGPYVGAFGGYSGGSSTQHDFGIPRAGRATTTTPPSEGGPDTGDGSYGLSGFVGGGLVGYNYQFQQVVVGVEGRIGGSTISGSSGSCGGGTVAAHTCGTRIDVEADVLGRIGYSFGPVLPYVTGGLALQNIHAYDALFGTSGSNFEPGWAVGAGVEYKIADHWSARLEYLHTDVGTHSVYQIVRNVPEYVTVRTDSVRASLSYSFSAPAAPVIAKY